MLILKDDVKVEYTGAEKICRIGKTIMIDEVELEFSHPEVASKIYCKLKAAYELGEEVFDCNAEVY